MSTISVTTASLTSSVLPKQHFTGNALDRSTDVSKRFAAALTPESEVSLVVVAGRDVVVRPVSGTATPGVQQELQALLLRSDDPELSLKGEQLSLNWAPSKNDQTYVAGKVWLTTACFVVCDLML